MESTSKSGGGVHLKSVNKPIISFNLKSVLKEDLGKQLSHCQTFLLYPLNVAFNRTNFLNN